MASTIAIVGVVFAILYLEIIAFILYNWLSCYFVMTKYKVPGIDIRFPYSALLFIFAEATSCLFVYPTSAIAFYFTKPDSYVLWNFHYFWIQTFILTPRYILLARVWVIAYRLKVGQQLENDKWFKYIDSNWQHKSAWLRYQHTLGNPKVVCFVIAFCTVLVAFICIVINWDQQVNSWQGKSTGKTVQYLQTLTVVMVGILLTFFTCTFPKFDDYFGLRKETFLLCLIFLMGFLWSILDGLIISRDWEHRIWVLYFVTGSKALLFAWVLLYRPLKALELPTNVRKLRKFSPAALQLELAASLRSSSMASFFGVTDTKSEESHEMDMAIETEIAKIELPQIIADYDCCCSFANHVNSEFALENLLFVYESYKYQKQMKNCFEMFKNEKIAKIVFAEQLPDSVIVNSIQNEDKASVARCNVELYWKYIDDDSTFCLNLSGDAREEVRNIFGVQEGTENTEQNKERMVAYFIENTSDEEYWSTWKDSQYTMYLLLTGALNRFKLTDKFENWFTEQNK